MERDRFREISLSLESWRFSRKGTESYMSELHAAAAALGISDDEMFDFFKEILSFRLTQQWQTQARAATERLTSKSVEELEISVRSYNCLKNANIQTVEQIKNMTDEELLKVKNMGSKSLKEIREAIARL
jgi:DNA-directed RNA polymerase subunit alpha